MVKHPAPVHAGYLTASQQFDHNERQLHSPARPMRPFRNATSTVPSMNSAAEIEKLLVDAGATSVSKWYEDKQLAGFLFMISLSGDNLVFRLPANVGMVARQLMLAEKHPDASMRTRIQAQAARTAWRTLHEWVQAQVNILEAGQADLLQVFLPYNFNQASGRSYYDYVKAGAVTLLAA